LAQITWAERLTESAEVSAKRIAGFTVHEVSLIQTNEILEDKFKLWGLSREIQDVRRLAADEAMLEPDSTLETSKWEAWYPSQQLLLSLSQPEKIAGRFDPSEPVRIDQPWYSWSESYLEWPMANPYSEDVPSNTLKWIESGRTMASPLLHSYLAAIVGHIGEYFSNLVLVLPSQFVVLQLAK